MSHALAGWWMAEALGWTLLHFVWQGAIAALIVWCGLALMARRSAQARYAVALLGLWGIVALPAITFLRLASEAYRLALAGSNSVIGVDALTIQVGADDAVSWTARLTGSLDHMLPWLMLAWCVGVVFFSCRLAVGIAVARALKLRDTEEVSAKLQAMFDGLRERLGVERIVRLAHSAKVHVPTVIGWLKPVVLVPAECLSGMSEEQIEALLAHEVAHVCRNDYLVSVFQQVVEALLFYHPAVWWISAQVRREREYCCDELAVGLCGDRLAYARALSLLEERRAMLPEMVLGANGGVLKMRIKRLLGCRDEVSTSQLAWAVLVAVAIAGGVAAIGRIAYAEGKRADATIVQGSNPPKQSLDGAPTSVADPDRVLGQATEAERMADDVVRQAQRLANRLSRLGSEQTRDVMEQDAAAQAERAAQWTEEDEKRLDAERKELEAHQKELQAAIKKLNSDEFKKQMDAARAQMDKLNSPEFRKEMEAAMAAAAKMNSDEMRKRLEDAQKRFAFSQEQQAKIQAKLNSPEFRKQLKDAQKRAEEKVNSPEFRKKMDDLNRQMKEKFNSPEFRKRMEDAQIQAQKFDSPEFRAKLDALNKDMSQRVDSPEFREHLRQMQKRMQEQMEKFNSPEFRKRLEDEQKSDALMAQNVGPSPKPAPEAEPASKATIAGAKPATAAAGKQLQVSPGVMAGQVITQVPPVYPSEAKEQKIQGTVVLKAIISKYGNVEKLQVVSGPRELMKSAMDAVSQWKYKPYLLNGEPTAVETTINVNYTLANDSKSAPESDQGTGGTPAIPKQSAVARAPVELRDKSGNAAVRIGGAVTAPVLIYKVDPTYTAEAKASKVKGPVLLNLIVNQKGEPENVRVVRGLQLGLDQNAVVAVRQYRFKPSTEDGKPVPVQLNVEVNYQLF